MESVHKLIKEGFLRAYSLAHISHTSQSPFIPTLPSSLTPLNPAPQCSSHLSSNPPSLPPTLTQSPTPTHPSTPSPPSTLPYPCGSVLLKSLAEKFSLCHNFQGHKSNCFCALTASHPFSTPPLPHTGVYAGSHGNSELPSGWLI